MAEHFTRFAKKKWPKYCLKTWQEQKEYNSLRRISAELYIPVSPELARKQPNEDGNIDQDNQ